ncbi:MAG TPA: hypothetical protein VFJ87_06525 [Rhodanobacteraceae bacterium]|jgi:hypothetical protein|nr:hypothetical protein [Rhodanobacteraceae bacterium]
MKRGNRNLAILVALAVALVAMVLIVGRREYLRHSPTLTTLDPARVSHIELDISPIAAQVFERHGDGWWRVEPSKAHADDARIQRLANLAATPVARWLPSAEIRPANVGLEHPSATLIVDGVKLEYGGLSAIGDFRYVRVAGKLALVPRQYSPEVMLTKPGG